jgi:opacity protein-like surface antigen
MLNLKQLALVSTTALTLIAAPAFASEGATEYKKTDQAVSAASNSGFYATVGAGLNITKSKVSGQTLTKGKGSKASATGVIGLGTNLADNFRADVTLNFTPSSKLGTIGGNGISVQNTALFLNGYYHFTDGAIAPYATAGIGFSRNNLEVSSLSVDKTKTSFAWQVGAGVTGPISENISWDAGYRYVNYGKYSTKGLQNTYPGLKLKTNSHVFLAGIRVGL